MATRPKPPSEGYEELSEADWGRLEARVRAFEDAWAAGRPPLLADHLAAEQPLAGALLVELVHADLHFRHKAGQPVRVA
ncbi:MAG TPA: hypothetical protein VF170_03000, partial [Planctomycetaceae bacterium]